MNQGPDQRPGEEVPWWSQPQPAPLDPISLGSGENLKTTRLPIRLLLAMTLLAGVLGGGVGYVAANFSDSGPDVHGVFPNSTVGLSANTTGGQILTTSTSTIERAPDSVAGIAARVLPSVVSISTVSSNGSGTGSGFVIRADGFILTNNHVVADAADGAGKISVQFNGGKSIPAEIVGRDTTYDLAVIKVNMTNLKPLVLGDSEKVVVGDSVIAIGSPLGLTGTVTTGVVSAKDRPVSAGGGMDTQNSFINAIQTDAAINPGNSGGPLVDATGAVIGINSAIASMGSSSGQSGSIGLGFAIPINQAKRTAEQLIATGKSSHPILGVSLDLQFAGPGAIISSVPGAVVKSGPADKAGLRSGDLILSIDGRNVANSEALIVAIRSHAPGDTVKITYSRLQKTSEVTVTLVAAPAN
jgi:putative serine protease PepD